MPTDLVVFLKEMPKGKTLPWPRPIKLIGLDLGPYACGGADRLCSTGYSQLYQSLKDANGQVIPNLLRKAGITDPGRVAFVGFSAAHGFLSPLLDNEADRRMIDSVILMDACFGSGKRGYQKALVDAAAGKMMLVILSTTIPGTPPEKSDVLHSGTLCVMRHIVEPTGMRGKRVAVRPPLPEPYGGVWKFGDLGFWIKMPDDAGRTLAPHYELGRFTAPTIEAYLLPRFQGKLGGGLPGWAPAAAGALLFGAVAWYFLGRRKKVALSRISPDG